MKKYTKYLLPIIIAFIFSCDNEPSDISALSAEDAITVNSELYNNIERVADENLENNLVCIDFIYDFTLNVFDEELELANVQILKNDLSHRILSENNAENFRCS